jgi:spore coat protein U-like protein
MKKFILTTLGVALMGVVVNANAATATATITPSLTILATCTIDVTGLDATFPSKALGATAAAGISTTPGTIAVSCPGAAYKFAAGAGVNWNGTSRALKNAAGPTAILYKLTVTGAGTSADWGDTGLLTVPATTTMPAITIAAGDPAGDFFDVTAITTSALTGTEPAAAYTDTVILTVEF